MNSRSLLTLTVVALLATAGVATAAVTGSPDISVYVTDDSVAPGEETTLDVVLVNSGDLESGASRNPALNSEVTTARGTTVTVESGDAPFEVTTGTQAVGTVPEGKTPPISFEISAPDDAEPGTYDVPVTVEYEYYSYVSESEGTRERESATKTFDVEVTVEDSAQLGVVDVDADTRVGGTGTVSMTVENVGSATATDTTISLASPSSDLTFGQSAEATRYVEEWTPGEQRTFEYQMTAARTADTEAYPFTLTADYDLPSGESRSTRPVTVPIQPEPEQEFTVVSTNNTVPVGGAGTYNVTIRNDGPDIARDASVQLTSQNADITFGQSNTASRSVGVWEAGEERTIVFDARASANAQQQAYSLAASVSFEDSAGNAGVVEGLTTELMPQQRRIAVVSTESSAPIGGSGEYTVTLRNDGPTALNDASVQLTSQNADVTFGQSNTASQFLGSWAVGEERTVTFDATVGQNAEQRDYALSATVNYERPSGAAGQQDGISLGLRPTPEQTFAVDNVESSLRVGDDGQLRGQITNTGTRAVSNVVVTWTSEQRNVDPIETEYSVGELGANESTSFDFDIDVSSSARSGPRQFTLQAQYENDEGQQRTSDPLTVRAPVEPESDEFDVAIQSANVTAGESTTIRLEIANAKSETLTDINGKIFADSPISTSDDEAFVSSLDPGESTTLTFSISASGSALDKTYPLSMDFQYDEQDGDTVTSDTYSIPIDVNRSDGGSDLPLGLIGGAVLLVIAIGGYLRFS
jgi:hypothetical protein